MYGTSVEVSVYLTPDAAGHGIGTRLYDALFTALATEDVHRAYAGIALPNAASVRLHERFGFAHVGTYGEVGRKFGRYWDVAWYEKRPDARFLTCFRAGLPARPPACLPTAEPVLPHPHV